MTRYEALRRELEQVEVIDGVTPLDILGLPSPLDQVVQEIMRRGSMTLRELAERSGYSIAQARGLGDRLVEKGYLHAEERLGDGGVVYRIYFARTRKRTVPDLF